ncbi:arginyl-tRNA synthetase [Raineyella antarctica]|uniref:Arginine--tRNA ligase n=1 Tax=Raineyella antarctica TaxID=1577474 RepID=A0A1G6GFK0_9ACTN|nr:arginine--tRNA ligase [Raineyella antarctica]SDB80669.1 arginyl-tRNA synthetase [Raineyella antarctica]
MSSLATRLSERFAAVTGGVDPELRPATKPQFGHFQCNIAMRLAKQEGAKPRDIAQRIVDEIRVDDLCEPLEIAGPGFINIRLKNSVLAEEANRLATDPAHGVPQDPHARRTIVDYSSPNVAKQMHVGHLRSTIIGDCFTRVLRATGSTVKPQNHIGDWGTQFGQLVEQILEEGTDVSALDLAGAEALYKRASAHFKADEDFADRARRRVVALQAGDEQTLGIWHQLIDVSLAGFNATYERMNILLTDDDLAGESTYNQALPKVVEDLKAMGLAVEDDGALVVWVEGFDAPMIVQKRDGGYGYDATDLAALRHRVDDLGAERIIYVTDARQAQHFAMVFAVARRAGWLPDSVSAEHIGFGMVLGADGKPFKTRDGSAVTLSSLLDAAEEIAAPPIALAAIKYADLSNGLNKDYVFDAERMVQTTGDTGPYLQYAHARTCAVMREAEAKGLSLDTTVTVLDDPTEQALALQLSRFGEAVVEVATTLQPHKLCTYLYELAQHYSAFYQQCPILKSEGAVRDSRLGLCRAVRTVLATGLDMLGIEALERM